MMRKIFPSGAGNTPFNSFKIFFLAEGYTAAQSAVFLADCLEFIELLYTVTPFNLTRTHPHWLSVYAGFSPSTNSGPAINTVASANRTAFESSYTSTTGLLTINQTKVNAFLDAETLSTSAGAQPVESFVPKGVGAFGPSGSVVVVLLPPITGFSQGGEFENTPGENDYPLIAVSKDGLWHQLILRTVAWTMGLGDEYELPGSDHLAPSTEQRISLQNYNLQYFESGPPNPVTSFNHWYSLMTATQRAMPPSVHAKANPNTVDTSLTTPPARPVGIEFHEGGGGFRTKVWRSAHDCLMRRKIGDSSLPLRGTLVPFCPACHHFLRIIIG